MAHARVVIDVFRPGTADEALRRTVEELVPLLRQQPGFIAYEVIRTGGDSAAFVHTCQTAEAAETATATVVAWAGRRLADMVVSVERHAGELVFSTHG